MFTYHRKSTHYSYNSKAHLVFVFNLLEPNFNWKLTQQNF